MDIVTPVSITDAMITASNIAEDDAAAWTAGTYDLGDVRMHNHSVWQSLIDINDSEPGTNALKWVRKFATNKFRPFDLENSAVATNADEITYTLKPGVRVDSIGLVSLDATEATVSVSTPGDGVVFTRTFELLRSENRDTFYTWFYAPMEYLREAVVLNIPAYSDAANATIDITITKTGDDAKVGEIVVGSSWYVGTTLYETAPRIRDFSFNERDAFGNAVLVKGQAIRYVTYRVAITTEKARYILDKFAALTSTRAMFTAGENLDQFGTTLIGTAKELEVPLEGPNVSEIEFEVEGFIG